MAVEDKYVDSDIAAGKSPKAHFNGGAKNLTQFFNFEVSAADDNGSIYRIAKDLPGDLIVKGITLFNDAIAAATDYDIGLYEPLVDGVGGDVIDKDVFLDGADISLGNTRASPLDGVGTVPIENVEKSILELAAHDFDTRKPGYDIAITANVVGTAAGTISGFIDLVQG